MVQLEVQKIDNTQLRINLYYKSEVTKAIQKYITIDLPQLEPMIHELTVRIPKLFLENGPDVDLLEKLKIEGQTLFQAMFGDMGSILRKLANPIEPMTMIIISDDVISNIPFEILYTGKSFLWEGFYISRQIATHGFTDADEPKKRRKIKKLIIVGDPSGDSEIANSIKDELYEISESWESTLDVSGPYFGPATNHYRLGQYLSTSDIFHFSGHYETNHKGVSGWRMDRGRIFSGKEISSLSQLPEFIFANTCGDTQSTGQGGFIREFLDKGVRSLLTTIGNVPSLQANYFSQLFYAGLQSGLPAAEAVYKARSMFIKRFGQSDISWMFYVLYGDGNFTIQISRRVSLSKNANTIKLGLKIAGILLLALLGKYGFEQVKSQAIEISTTPSGLKLTISGSTRGVTPITAFLSPMDDIDISASNYDVSKFELEKIKGEWILVPEIQNVYILAGGELSPQSTAKPGSMHANLIKVKYNYITFKNVNTTNSIIMIQGNDTKLTGDEIMIAVDNQKYRFIIEQDGNTYDNHFSVDEDIEVNVADLTEKWNKNRFK